jgi:hypothetical protein
MTFSVDDIVTVFNLAGFDSFEQAVASLVIGRAFLEAGFNDPSILTPVLQRFKLINEKMGLQTQAASLQLAQQEQVRALLDQTNPPIGELNQQIAAIDAQLAQIPGA